MNLITFDNPGFAGETEQDLPAEGTTLFTGDSGELALETRRVLVQLLKGPSLDGERQTQLWPTLLRDEVVLRRRLSELFLELVVDVEGKVAFIRRADTSGIEAPQILRQRKLRFVDSVLMLYLRQVLMQAAARGERAVVSLVEISEHLKLYQPSGSSDQAVFAKRIHAAVERATSYDLLRSIPRAEDRYEVSPALRLLFAAEQVSELTRLYAQMRDAAESGAQAEDELAEDLGDAA